MKQVFLFFSRQQRAALTESISMGQIQSGPPNQATMAAAGAGPGSRAGNNGNLNSARETRKCPSPPSKEEPSRYSPALSEMWNRFFPSLLSNLFKKVCSCYVHNTNGQRNCGQCKAAILIASRYLSYEMLPKSHIP